MRLLNSDGRCFTLFQNAYAVFVKSTVIKTTHTFPSSGCEIIMMTTKMMMALQTVWFNRCHCLQNLLHRRWSFTLNVQMEFITQCLQDIFIVRFQPKLAGKQISLTGLPSIKREENHLPAAQLFLEFRDIEGEITSMRFAGKRTGLEYIKLHELR
jgi:hypothetical protein